MHSIIGGIEAAIIVVGIMLIWGLVLSQIARPTIRIRRHK